jgi:hypothetical protein
MSSSLPEDLPSIGQLFPLASRVLLTGTGKQLVERLGEETVREIILGVMMGENIRSHTEPLTRQRLAQISGALVTMFTQGWLEIEGFSEQLSNLALQQLKKRGRRDKVDTLLAKWVLGLTEKSNQNVLRGETNQLETYVADFESAIRRAADRCREDIGDLRMVLGYAEDLQGRRVELEWKDIIKLTTAIGALTLFIRGSDKSMFGKLFEGLILGSFLTILGFERVDPATNEKNRNVFWLSNMANLRESDATLLLRPGKLAKFDIGFIGRGNPEIARDKLTRFISEVGAGNNAHLVPFIIIDRLPDTETTRRAAEQAGAEIVQMSMQYWPRELAQKLGQRLGVQHELQEMPDRLIRGYLASKLSTIRVQDFLSDVRISKLQEKSPSYGSNEVSGVEEEVEL